MVFMHSLTTTSATFPPCPNLNLIPTKPLTPSKASSKAPLFNPPSPKIQVRNKLFFKFPLPHSLTLTASSFSPKTLNLLQKSIQSSLSDSTIAGYSLALSRFLIFCDHEHIPSNLRFPADEFVLCAFAASNAGQISGETVHKYIFALKAWHILHNVDWKGGPHLNFILNGVKNLTPLSSRRPPRPPVNTTMISSLLQSLNLHNPLDAAVAAATCVAFWGQCHLGELLPTSQKNCATLSIPARHNLSTNSPRCLGSSYALFLPCTKTKKHGESITLVSQLGPSDPLRVLQNHLRINSLPSSLLLFAYTTPQGSVILTRRRLMLRCNEIWSKFGYPRTTGHSFHIGGTTELLLSGVPPDVVKALGRWSSDSFLRYWRSLDVLAPRYTKNIRHGDDANRPLSEENMKRR